MKETKIELEFLQLHAGDPLFFKGINFGEKLYKDPRKSKAPLKMEYDTELGVAFVSSGGKTTLIPSFASATIYSDIEVHTNKPTHVSHPVIAGVAAKAQVGGPNEVKLQRTAQVSTPMDKVQGTPGRKAKYQGGENQGE